jgi:hypothetical protein
MPKWKFLLTNCCLHYHVRPRDHKPDLQQQNIYSNCLSSRLPLQPFTADVISLHDDLRRRRLFSILELFCDSLISSSEATAEMLLPRTRSWQTKIVFCVFAKNFIQPQKSYKIAQGVKTNRSCPLPPSSPNRCCKLLCGAVFTDEPGFPVFLLTLMSHCC